MLCHLRAAFLSKEVSLLPPLNFHTPPPTTQLPPLPTTAAATHLSFISWFLTLTILVAIYSSDCYRMSIILQITWVVSSAKRPSLDTPSFVGVTGSWFLIRFVAQYCLICNNPTTHRASLLIWATLIACHITVVTAHSSFVAFEFLAMISTRDGPIKSGHILIWFRETRLCLPSPPAQIKLNLLILF